MSSQMNPFSSKTTIKQIITIKPKEINDDIDNTLLKKLRDGIGNKCTSEGYVMKDSIQIIEHGPLNIEISHFNGNLRVPVTFTCDVINPVANDIIECTITKFNEFAVIAKNHPLNIIILLDKQKNIPIVIGNVIKVKIIKSTLNLNDETIDICASFYNENDKIKKSIIKEKKENVDVTIDEDIDGDEESNIDEGDFDEGDDLENEGDEGDDGSEDDEGDDMDDNDLENYQDENKIEEEK